MSVITNPVDFDKECVILQGRNIVLDSNYNLLSFDKLLSIKNRLEAHFPKAVLEFFVEENFDICVLAIDEECDITEIIKEDYLVLYLREYFSLADKEQVFKVSRGKALFNWMSNTRFCSKCGSKLEFLPKDTGKICHSCKSTHYPKIEPCIIMRIEKGNEILLARHVKRNQDIYACIAGFVEAGENLENACKREVYEETGIVIKNIKYLGSQSWPFPYQLMLAFSAEYESGELIVQEDEIETAGWFDKNNLPLTPDRGSISYDLINFLI